MTRRTATSSAHRFGRWAEEAAASWYRAAGYEVLDRNWRCGSGELDLVVANVVVVAFVEVKARSSGRYGSGLEAVDWRKQRRVRGAAAQWLEVSDRHFADVRFDVVDVDRRGALKVLRGCF